LRVIIAVVQVYGAVKIPVAAKEEKQDETQFTTTKIARKISLSLSYFVR
jgi:hypothetical protein